MTYLDIHFLDVGHGDCTIVEFPDHLTVIDINNCKTLARESEAELKNKYRPPVLTPLPAPYQAAARALSGPGPSIGLSGLAGIRMRPINPINTPTEMAEAARKLQEARDRLTSPIDYLKARFTTRSIFRYIQTHPDMDHMAGLHRICVDEKYQIVNMWDTKHCIEKDEDALRAGASNHDINDWHSYLALRKGTGTASPTVLHLKAGDVGNFWTTDGIEIWAPFDHAESNNPKANPNSLSYVLSIKVGSCTIVLGGDADITTWEEIHKKRKGVFPKVNLLKASHHGRKSGYHYESVKAMNPDLTVLSVGELKKKDDASASYERFNKGSYSTLDHGNIIARCWENGSVYLYDPKITEIARSS